MMEVCQRTTWEPADGLEYHPESDTYRTRHDWGDSESICYTIVNAVASLRGVDPLEVEPLGTRLDTDALENLFGRRTTLSGHVSFRLDECRVTVHADGKIVIRVLD